VTAENPASDLVEAFTGRALLRPAEKKFLPPFFPEASRQLKLLPASLPLQGLERANQAFSHEGFLCVIKREDVGGQKWPVQIYDPGLFCACQACSETVCAIPLFEERSVERISLC